MKQCRLLMVTHCFFIVVYSPEDARPDSRTNPQKRRHNFFGIKIVVFWEQVKRWRVVWAKTPWEIWGIIGVNSIPRWGCTKISYGKKFFWWNQGDFLRRGDIRWSQGKNYDGWCIWYDLPNSVGVYLLFKQLKIIEDERNSFIAVVVKCIGREPCWWSSMGKFLIGWDGSNIFKISTAGLQIDTGRYEFEDLRSLIGFGTTWVFPNLEILFREGENLKMFSKNTIALSPICSRRTVHGSSGPIAFGVLPLWCCSQLPEGWKT